MTRQTAEKYSQFLDELVDQEQFGGVTNVGNIVTKYGITPAFFSFLVKRGYFEKVAGSKAYIPTSVMKDRLPLIVVDAQILINEFNRWKQIKKDTGAEEIDPPVRFDAESEGITTYTTKELINELKRRGYTGVMTVKKEIKF